MQCRCPNLSLQFSTFNISLPSPWKYFHQHRLTFALGVSVATAALSKMCSKATVAPVAEYFGTYKASLVFVGLWQVCFMLSCFDVWMLFVLPVVCTLILNSYSPILHT